MATGAPLGRASRGGPRVKLPLWLKITESLTLLATLLLLVLSVMSGSRGQLDLSNLLAMASLLPMGTFALVSLSQERALARRTLTPAGPSSPP